MWNMMFEIEQKAFKEKLSIMLMRSFAMKEKVGEYEGFFLG
jgi:hypothetical protein